MIERIYDICRKYRIKNFTINDDGSIDVEGNVNLGRWNMDEFPLKFNKVTGNFYCDNIGLKTLKGAPKWVGGMFGCSANQLTSLVGSPEYVGKGFFVDSNKLTSLDGCPKEIGKDFNFDMNDVYSLDGAKETKVGRLYTMQFNPISWIFYEDSVVKPYYHVEPELVEWIIKTKVINIDEDENYTINTKRLQYAFSNFDKKVNINSALTKYYSLV